MKPNIEGYNWKKKIQSKINSNKKINNQIWYINKMRWYLLILVRLVWNPEKIIKKEVGEEKNG